jgi:hypothetical protein
VLAAHKIFSTTYGAESGKQTLAPNPVKCMQMTTTKMTHQSDCLVMCHDVVQWLALLLFAWGDQEFSNQVSPHHMLERLHTPVLAACCQTHMLQM